MKSNGETMQCPFCGGSVDDLMREQIGLLRAAMLSDIVPALFHDARHLLASVHQTHEVIARNFAAKPKDDRLPAFLKRGEQLQHELRQFFHTLRLLFRTPDNDVLIEVRDLPDNMRWIWDFLASVRGDVGSKTTFAFGDPGGSAGSRWPARAEASHSSTPLRRLSLNPLGNLLRFGYHSAPGTSPLGDRPCDTGREPWSRLGTSSVGSPCNAGRCFFFHLVLGSPSPCPGKHAWMPPRRSTT